MYPLLSQNKSGGIVDDDKRDKDEKTHLAQGNFDRGRKWFVIGNFRDWFGLMFRHQKIQYNEERKCFYAFEKQRPNPTIVLSGHTHKNRAYAIRVYKKVGNIVDSISVENKDIDSAGKLKEKLTFLDEKSPIFLVTTSSAYSSQSFKTPGYRITRFVQEENWLNIETTLHELEKLEDEGLNLEELPEGHPRKK